MSEKKNKAERMMLMIFNWNKSLPASRHLISFDVWFQIDVFFATLECKMSSNKYDSFIDMKFANILICWITAKYVRFIQQCWFKLVFIDSKETKFYQLYFDRKMIYKGKQKFSIHQNAKKMYFSIPWWWW